MRPVIWIILAILVVAAIVFVVIARKGATPDRIRREMTPEAYMKFADRMDKNIATYEERIAKLIAKGISPSAQPIVEQYNAKLNELKEAVADLRANPAEEKVERIRTLYKELRKLFRDLGGSGGQEEGEE